MKPKDALPRLRKERGMSQQELADKIGVKQNTIAAIETGVTKHSKHLPAIARALGVRLSDLDSSLAELNETMPNDNHRVLTGERDLPVYASAEGGGGTMVLSSDPIDYVVRPDPLAKVKDAYAVIVVGDSMTPAFEPGDTLLVNPHLPPLPDTDVVLYSGEGSEMRVCVKRLKRANNEYWHLIQWNPPAGEKETFVLRKSEWPTCHRIVGKYSRR